MVDRIKEPWGTRTPFGRGGEWPVRVDQFLEEGVSEEDVDRWGQTASILHSNGDALDIAVKDGRMAGAVLLTVVGWLINRASGVPVPAWGATG